MHQLNINLQSLLYQVMVLVMNQNYQIVLNHVCMMYDDVIYHVDDDVIMWMSCVSVICADVDILHVVLTFTVTEVETWGMSCTCNDVIMRAVM